jgi:hypothetical protein
MECPFGFMREYLRVNQEGSVKMLVGGWFAKTATTDMAHLADTDHYNFWLGSIDAEKANDNKSWLNGSLIDTDIANKKEKSFYTMLFRWRWFGVVEVFAFAEPNTTTQLEGENWSNETLIPELVKLYALKESGDLAREKALLDMRK